MVARLFLCLALVVVLLAPLVTPLTPARAADPSGRVMVCAAASLSEAIEGIASGFETATGHKVVVVLAGSSALARQIQAGAPADIYLSANAAWMDVLAADGLLADGTRFDLAGNRLVLIAHGAADPIALGPDTALANHLNGGRLGVALTQAVPAGIYAKAALQSLGLWDTVADKLAETDNVRAALALVALGEAPLGIVYATDARADPRVSVIATFPADSHGAIVYPAARIAGRRGAAADAFLAWLKSPDARAILTRHGFTVGG